MPAVGWCTQLPADYLGRYRTLDIVLGREFPTEPPQFWVEPNAFLEWPHAESTGKLCLWPDDSTPTGLKPSEWIGAALDRFRRLFVLVGAGSDTDARGREFAAEWTSYWIDPKRPTAHCPDPVLMLSSPPKVPTSMKARVTHAQEHGAKSRMSENRSIVVCDSNADLLNRWVRNASLASMEMQTNEALCIPLYRAPNQPGATTTIDQVRSFINCFALKDTQAQSAFERLLANESKTPRWLVFVHDESALVGLRLTPMYRKEFARGHQNRKTRRGTRKQQRRNGFRIEVAAVQRADPAWIQERDQNVRYRPLLNAHVLIVGAGSLGSMVAEGLAMSGTGRLTIVDPGMFETANVGRHVLGITSTGKRKACALRNRLLADYPHSSVEAVAKPVQVTRGSLKTAAYNLVICTAADPACEAFLMHRLDDQVLTSLILAWCEPHALAGHSAHSPGPPYAVQELFSQGRCIEAATEWADSQTIALPGCGVSHLPGAGNRIRLISAFVAEHAIAVLTGDGGVGEHRVWVAGNRAVEAMGGLRKMPASGGEATTVCRAIPQKLPKYAASAGI